MARTADKVKETCGRLLEMFRTGEIPPAVARTTIRALNCDLPSSKWSLGNRLLMFLSGTDDARGFRQWEEVGRKVKKGAKAFYILGPCTKRVVKKRTDEKGQEIEEEKAIVSGFKALPVFRYEDTEGEEILRPDYTPPEMPPLVEVARAYGITVKYGPFTKRFYGCYQPSAQEIFLCTHDVDTFFHELAHAIHNTIRPLQGGQHAGQEIVAETVAAVLCEMYGYTGYLDHGYRYIEHYAQGENGAATVQAMMKVLADVQMILQVILDSAGNSSRYLGEAL
ncbi:MAG: ArdC-like ssDNA-binding domain-containing protein [Bacillota bacterium]